MILIWFKGVAGWARSSVGHESDLDAVADVLQEGFDALAALVPDGAEESPDPSPLVPLSDQAALDMEARGWAHQWAVDAEYREPAFGDGVVQALPT